MNHTNRDPHNHLLISALILFGMAVILVIVWSSPHAQAAATTGGNHSATIMTAPANFAVGLGSRIKPPKDWIWTCFATSSGRTIKCMYLPPAIANRLPCSNCQP